MNVQLRRLETHDLDAVETIERASYPTPWSRSMFDAELRKPSSLALGAFTADDASRLRVRVALRRRLARDERGGRDTRIDVAGSRPRSSSGSST